ncbi:MAG: hypothetical protein ACK47B_21685 [Armatimonadota bacterium]
MSTKGAVRRARAAALLDTLRRRPERMLRLDHQGWLIARDAGFSRADLERAADDLAEGGRVEIVGYCGSVEIRLKGEAA